MLDGANPACTLKIVRMIGQQLSLCFVPRANLPGVAVIGVEVLPAYAANVLVKDSGGLRVACCLHVSISWLVTAPSVSQVTQRCKCTPVLVSVH